MKHQTPTEATPCCTKEVLVQYDPLRYKATHVINILITNYIINDIVISLKIKLTNDIVTSLKIKLTTDIGSTPFINRNEIRQKLLQ